MMRWMPMPRVSPVMLVVALLACGRGDDGAEKAGAAGKPSGGAAAQPVAAAPSGAAPAAEKRRGPCADFAACRDACVERRPGGCVRMHEQARKRDQDRAESEKTASRMCDAGHPEACHVRHVQLQSDRRRSLQALTRACELGYGQACLSLAGRSRDRSKVDELRKRGVFLLDRFCQREDPYACTARGDAARDPGDGEDPDPAAARWHFEKGCNLGDGDGCYALVQLLGGQQPEREVALLDRACELGEPRACASAGDHYASGDHVVKDIQHAAEAWQKACDSGADQAYHACDSLADALSDGRLPRDADRAAALRKRGEELASQFEGD
jgi:uncharacterized protein